MSCCYLCLVLTCVSLFVVLYFSFVFFFFKQKTAYEMRISDWSSDVCSSDLPAGDGEAVGRNTTRGRVLARAGIPDDAARHVALDGEVGDGGGGVAPGIGKHPQRMDKDPEIGRAHV